MFEFQLIKVINGEDVVKLAENYLQEKEKKFWNESELSIKNIFKRVVIYSLIILIGMAFFLILREEFNVKTILILGIFILISANYLYSDIKIIKEKQRKN